MLPSLQRFLIPQITSSRIGLTTSVWRSLRFQGCQSIPIRMTPKLHLSHGLASMVPITLSNLSDNRGAVKTKRRVGRGNGSGRGGTCGRGHKGQKARSGTGKPRIGFEGGQTPLSKRIPKRGFTNVHGKELVPVNLDRLQRWIDVGRLNPEKPITMKELFDAGLVHQIKDGVKLLGAGAAYLRTPIHIEVTQASKSAIEAIEKIGGKIVTVYYNTLGLRALIKPHKFRILPRRAEPTNSKDIDYYADEGNRGYIALNVQPTFPAPTAIFYGGMKEPIQYTYPPMAPLKPTAKLLALREAQKERGVQIKETSDEASP